MTNFDDYSFQDIWQEREWRKCAPQTSDPDELLKGFIHFCENYWYIRHPERGRIKFELYDSQIETIRMWLSHRWSIVLKARQIGFSTLVAAYAYWLAFFYRDRPILMLSRTEREAIKLLAKAKYGRQFLPEWMQFRGGPYNATQTRMEFDGQASYIESLPSASDPARGESAYLVVVDEMAFLPNSEEAWAAIEPVADVGGRVIMLSTANGEGNMFHQLWVGAETKTNRFTPLFFPWSANGRSEEWYESKKLDLPEWQLAQEYPSDPEEAFLKSGRPVFNLERLRQLETKKPVRGYIDEKLEFREDGGALRLWKFPEKNGRYVIGADPSQGFEHGDYASAHVINARNYEVVAHYHGHIDPDLFGTDVLVRLGKWYNQALIGVESNNHGLAVLKAIQRTRYFPLYYDRHARSKRPVQTEQLGFLTSQVTKPLMVDDLQEALRGSMKLWCEETIAELRTFVREESASSKSRHTTMHGQPWDDRTISLAIANQMLKYVWMAEFQPKEDVQPGSWDDWQRRTYGKTMQEVLEGKKAAGQPRKPIGTFAVRSKG